jgi:hypothetical protein
MTPREKLHIADKVALPLDWMTMATVVYGARGSGKSTLGAVVAEELNKAKQRFCAIDLKGDFYGLKSSRDGKSEAIPVVIFGGDHRDLPLEEGAGKFVAETIAGLDQSTILDLEHFSKGKQIKFLGEFFAALYDANREPLLMILDEAQRYAPQKPISPDSAICLGAVEDLVKLGRKHGLGVMLLTQRGSGLNKEVSEICDMLVAFRTPGPLDQGRVRDWLEANVTEENRDTAMEVIAGLDTGTAVFASGHPSLKLFGVAHVRERETFDSSATPKVGQRKAEPKKLARPDLAALEVKMAASIERAKADDPKALRLELAALKKELATERAKKSEPKVERVEVEVLSASERKALDSVLAQVKAVQDTLLYQQEKITEWTRDLRVTATALGGKIQAAARGNPVSLSRAPSPSAVSRAPVAARVARRRSETGDVKLGLAERKILTVLAQHEEGCPAGKLTLLAGYRWSGGFRNSLSVLRTAGLIDGANGGTMRITAEGVSALGEYDSLPAPGPELQNYWLGHASLGGCERKILSALIEAYPVGLEADELTKRTGYEWSGGFRNSLSVLRTAGLLEGRNSEAMRASETLFDGGA